MSSANKRFDFLACVLLVITNIMIITISSMTTFRFSMIFVVGLVLSKKSYDLTISGGIMESNSLISELQGCEAGSSSSCFNKEQEKFFQEDPESTKAEKPSTFSPNSSSYYAAPHVEDVLLQQVITTINGNETTDKNFNSSSTLQVFSESAFSFSLHLSPLTNDDVNASEWSAASREDELMLAENHSDTHQNDQIVPKSANLEYDIMPRIRTPLHQAADIGDFTGFKTVFWNGETSIDAQDANGWTPLHEASRGGFTEIVQFLLENGANVNMITPSQGDTPLGLAKEFHGHNHPIIDLLRDAGAIDV